jgi:alkylated DNA repair dioxygenase AlkB
LKLDTLTLTKCGFYFRTSQRSGTYPCLRNLLLTHGFLWVLQFNPITQMIAIIPEFITQEEEQVLLINLKPSRVSGGFKRNRILRYGSDKPYKGVKSSKIPDWLKDICVRVTYQWRENGITDAVDHITINEYMPGQYIDWHVDSPGSGPIITVLSLESPATMGLRPEDKTILDGEQMLSLPERSLLHMTGFDRWQMEHCTYPSDRHRWSIVFRKGT